VCAFLTFTVMPLLNPRNQTEVGFHWVTVLWTLYSQVYVKMETTWKPKNFAIPPPRLHILPSFSILLYLTFIYRLPSSPPPPQPPNTNTNTNCRPEGEHTNIQDHVQYFIWWNVVQKIDNVWTEFRVKWLCVWFTTYGQQMKFARQLLNTICNTKL
jgi:hypothetical protein